MKIGDLIRRKRNPYCVGQWIIVDILYPTEPRPRFRIIGCSENGTEMDVDIDSIWAEENLEVFS